LRERRRARFADSAGRFSALHDVHFDWSRLIDAQHPVATEVVLLDATIRPRA
jgi:hypothetical protein